MKNFSNLFVKIFFIAFVIFITFIVFLVISFFALYYYSKMYKESNVIKSKSVQQHSNSVNNVKNKTIRYALVDANNKLVYKDYFLRVESIYKNYYVVYLQDNSVGVIDNTGKYILKPEFSKITECGNSLFCTYKKNNNNKAEIYDTKGKLLLKDKYIKPLGLNIDAFTGKNYIFASDINVNSDEPKQLSLFDGDLNEILTIENKGIVNLYSDNYFVTLFDSKIKLIDFKGKTIFEPNYDYIGKSVVYKNKEYFIVGNSYRYGVVDSNNKVILPLSYSTIYFSEKNGLIWANKANIKGFPNIDAFDCFDFSGNVIKNPDISKSPYGKYTILSTDKRISRLINKYFYINSIGVKYYVVSKNNKAGVIDIDDNVLVPIKYKNCLTRDFSGYFVCTASTVGFCSTSIPSGQTCTAYFDVYDTKKTKLCSGIRRAQVNDCINNAHLKNSFDEPVRHPLIKMYNEFPMQKFDVYKKSQKRLLFGDNYTIKINDNGLSFVKIVLKESN